MRLMIQLKEQITRVLPAQANSPNFDKDTAMDLRNVQDLTFWPFFFGFRSISSKLLCHL